jgi:hypothetical protein
MKMDLGSNVATTLAGGLSDASDLAIDDASLYFMQQVADASDGRALFRTSKNGGEVEELVRWASSAWGSNFGSAVAAGPSGVYFLRHIADDDEALLLLCRSSYESAK